MAIHYQRENSNRLLSDSVRAAPKPNRREMLRALLITAAAPLEGALRFPQFSQGFSETRHASASTDQHTCPRHSGDAKIIFPTAEESTVAAISGRGDCVGLVRLAEERVDRAFVYHRASSRIVEPLTPYTLADVKGVSGTGLVVGHLYSPSTRGTPAMAPFVFDCESGQSTTLPLPDKSRVALATGISDCGTVVVGSYAGNPCIWLRCSEQGWRQHLLEGPEGQGITSVNVRISSGGKRVVATGALGGNRSVVVEWVNRGDQWLALIRDTDRFFGANAVNDDGLICGSVPEQVHGGATTRAAALDPSHGFIDIGWLEGHNNSFATAVTTKGSILVSSLSMGPEGETKIFLFEQGKQQPIDFSDHNVKNRYGTCINENGQIGGHLDFSRGEPNAAYAYVWTPHAGR